MEEARVDYLDKIGYGYKKLEDSGIISPVIGVECDYKSPTTFDDTVMIKVEVEEFKGVKLTLKYTMVNASDGKTVALGRSKHCFTDTAGRPVALKKTNPELDSKFKELAESN